MRPIDWDDDPSFPVRHSVQVFSVPPNTATTIRFLGQYQGVWTHWLKQGRSERPAPHFKTDCQHCKGDSKRWKAYIPSLRWQPGQKNVWLNVVCELTQLAFNELAGQTDVTKLRGKVVEVSRGKTSSGMHCRFLEDPQRDLNHLPEPFDVMPILLQLWGMAEATKRSEHVWQQVPPPEKPAPYLPPPVEKPVPEKAPPGAFKMLRERLTNGEGGVH